MVQPAAGKAHAGTVHRMSRCRLPSQFIPHGSVAMDTVHEVGRVLGVTWDPDYAEFLAETDGGEGPVGAEGYARFWSASELTRENAELDQLPGGRGSIVFFGSDGGNEQFGFDTANGMCVVQVPLLPFDLEEAQRVGSSFSDFLESQ